MKNNKTIFGKICNMKVLKRGLTVEAKKLCNVSNRTVQYLGKSELEKGKRSYVKNNDRKSFFRKMG